MSPSPFRLTVLSALFIGLCIAGCNRDSEEPAEAAGEQAADAAVTPETTAAPAPEPAPLPAPQYEVLVFGSAEETRAWLVSENWWGTDWNVPGLEVPHLLMTGLTERWRTEAQAMPVENKKEAFFRFMLPLVLHANELVLKHREKVEGILAHLDGGGTLDEEQVQYLRRGAVVFRVATEDEVATLTADSHIWRELIDALLYRLDFVPPGLALGQAAYESGWGTSRFAQEGNAFFGQWTYGGEGLKPAEQRSHLGDHRIAAFDWPFDSVRGYFLNLMSHPAYEDFRRLRAQRRAAGESLDSLHLADGLLRYSERGQEYVDGLKGIITKNHFDAADTAVFRDEPIRFYVGAETPEDAEKLRADIARMRETGELKAIYERMRLE